MRRVDGLIQYSDYEVSRMTAIGISESKIFIAHNTLPIPNHADGSGAFKDSFLFSGRIRTEKKVDIFIRAFSEVISHIPETIKINIIGSGVEKDRLKVLAEELGVSDRVIFHGEIFDENKLRPFFHRALAYVSPGAVGLSVLHSFAYGLPIVTQCDERHGPEFVNVRNKENSLVYKTYDDLKGILIRLCHDKALSARMGKNAYDLYAEERTFDVMIEGFRNAIENIDGKL